jgi:hypothetical protein
MNENMNQEGEVIDIEMEGIALFEVKESKVEYNEDKMPVSTKEKVLIAVGYDEGVNAGKIIYHNVEDITFLGLVSHVDSLAASEDDEQGE